MAVKQVHFLISIRAASRMAVAGLSPGWLLAWGRSAGHKGARLEYAEPDEWQLKDGKQVFIGLADEIAAIRTRLERTDAFTPVHAPASLSRQHNKLILYNKDNRLCCIFIAVDEVVARRHQWLSILADDDTVLPLNVWPGEADHGVELEPGLRGDTGPVPAGTQPLNTEGLLPEEQLVRMLAEREMRVRFAESCTAGGMCERLSRVPGASSVLDRGWVVYSNQAKQDMLGLSGQLIREYGAVSRETVEAMAESGVAERTACVAVSGIAGPGGGSKEKPVGTVWLAVSMPGGTTVSRLFRFPGARAEVRARSVIAGFVMLIQSLSLIKGNYRSVK